MATGRAGDRDIVVSGGHDQMVWIWDAATGVPIGAPLTGHTELVYAVAIGRAGDRDVIVSGGFDGTVRIWDAVTGDLIGEPLIGHTGVVLGVVTGRIGDLASSSLAGSTARCGSGMRLPAT
ncbi:MAG: hypothetical protein IRY85_19165 [Micromonosporaceae bacterium]|nr:hypothetical protein [Micromonosporaceae bacterium]